GAAAAGRARPQDRERPRGRPRPARSPRARLRRGGPAPRRPERLALERGRPHARPLARGATPRRPRPVMLRDATRRWAWAIVALTPEMAVGLFALTPDLLLAYAWTGCVALAALGLRGDPRSVGTAGALLGAGVLAGVASVSKASGLALFPVLAAAWISPAA